MTSTNARPELGLRARRHRQTREDLVVAAFDLFGQRDFAEVTMEEIARAAGVSRSTAYRRFPTKEDLVLEVPRRWLDVFDVAAEGLAPDTPLDEAFAITAEAVAAHIDDHLDLVRAAYELLERMPTLQVSGLVNTAWLARMVSLIERHGWPDGERAAIVAGAYLGGIDAMMLAWSAAGGRESVVAATRRAHANLRPLLTDTRRGLAPPDPIPGRSA